MIRTIIFDLDGTLLNTLEDLADAANWVCEQNHWPTHPLEAYRYFVGNGIPKLVERFSPPEARTPEQLARTLAQFTARYDAHKEDKTAPYPGIPALLEALAAQGVRTAVFSNKADPCAAPSWTTILAPAALTGCGAAAPASPPSPTPPVCST